MGRTSAFREEDVRPAVFIKESLMRARPSSLSQTEVWSPTLLGLGLREREARRTIMEAVAAKSR